MADCRVRIFLLTYRRPQLLRRALGGLLAQTHRDWICELHNDDPEDDEPEQILGELASGDARFEYRAHAQNLGPVASFNLVFAGGGEPYTSLLEDDNWWEPNFLRTALETISAHPTAALVWANMRLWEETADGTWRDTNRTIWPSRNGNSVVVFEPPEIIQAFDALHSNGAMVFRAERFRSSSVPITTPFSIIEPLRERAASGPLLLISSPLANFALTRRSTRRADMTEWAQAKLLVAASFFSMVPVSASALQRIWIARRALRPTDTDVFFQLAIALRQPRLLRFARLNDVIRFGRGILRHPLRQIRILRFRSEHQPVWNWLISQTLAWSQASSATITSKRDVLPCTESSS